VLKKREFIKKGLRIRKVNEKKVCTVIKVFTVRKENIILKKPIKSIRSSLASRTHAIVGQITSIIEFSQTQSIEQ
jgi:hypothetical protein